MNVLHRWSSRLLAPFIALSLAGGVASLAWLAWLGKWFALLTGVCGLISGVFLVSLLLLPGIYLLGAPSLDLLDRGRVMAGYALTLLGLAWIYGVTMVWCIVSLVMFMNMADVDSLAPLAIFSFTVGTFPWTLYAWRQSARSFAPSTVTAITASLAYLTCVLLVLFSPPTMSRLFLVFGSFMAFSAAYVFLSMATAEHEPA
ncbi:MAG: hypothetical protein AB7D51_15055 [Desulfovibrionaceae bacterium]